jgi:lipoate-protein ligase A
MKIFFSPFKNPYLNLALEDYFLRAKEDLPLVLFYVNRPCVVFGRFQNPWVESNLMYLSLQDIWPVRRQSGGGCVFHDEGNLNFSYISPDPVLQRSYFSQLLREAFLKVGIELEISPRNDLFLKGKKISGSAYKQTKSGSFHHGTFLVNSDLTALEASLKASLNPSNTKSISSVRSQVTSLEEHFPFIKIEDVVEFVSHFFNQEVLTIEGTLLSSPLLQESFYRLISWDWIWGETPYFEIQNKIKVRKGNLLPPLEGRFSKENLLSVVSEKELEQWFPDFSELHKSNNLIF